MRATDFCRGTVLALEFLMMTAVRSGEVRKAMWKYIDIAVWMIPAERMKSGREYRVPLAGNNPLYVGSEMVGRATGGN